MNEDKRVLIVAALLLVVVMVLIVLTSKFIIKGNDAVDNVDDFDDGFGDPDIHNSEVIDDDYDDEGEVDADDQVEKPGNDVVDSDEDLLPARGNLDAQTVTNLVNEGIHVNDDGSIDIDYSFNVLGQLRTIAKYTDSKDFKYVYGSLPNADEYLLVFEFESCGMCREFLPILFNYNNLEPQEGVIPVFILDIDEENNRKLLAEYGVTETPTTLYFKDGVEIDRIIGRKTEAELIDFVKSKQ